MSQRRYFDCLNMLVNEPRITVSCNVTAVGTVAPLCLVNQIRSSIVFGQSDLLDYVTSAVNL